MRILLVTLSLITLCGVTKATDANIFREQIQIGSKSLEKSGEYRYVYRLFFDLYETALFVAPGAKKEAVLKAECAFQLRFRYLREIEKAIILKSANKMLDKNLSEVDKSSIRNKIDLLNQYYRTVRDGDESSLTYFPGEGTTLRVNGESLCTIEGQDFARLYFQIWFGSKPISKSLKTALLGE